MEQLLVVLLVRLAASTSVASLLSRSGRFLNLLLREQRNMGDRLQIALATGAVGAAGASVRIFTRSYAAADISLPYSLLAGVVGGYIPGLIGGVLASIPAMMNHEYLAMPLYAAAGVLGGLLRDLAPDPEDIWRFSPFFDLSIWRLIRYPSTRARSAYHLALLFSILLVEFAVLGGRALFGDRMVFSLYPGHGWGAGLLIMVSGVFTVTLPLKIWNSARNERLLENKERLLVQARLSALSSQINPHFLFNTLNTVRSLIRTNPEEARRVVGRLSSILRRLLRKTEHMATLREELAFIEDYLSIEVARFGEKLRFVKEVDESTLECQVPPMLLQPLVENSIKHGLAPKVDGGTIVVRSGWIGYGDGPRWLHLSVEDDGVGISDEKLGSFRGAEPGHGIGVRNVNERLQVLYGDNYHMSVHSRPGGGTRTDIEILSGAKA